MNRLTALLPLLLIPSSLAAQECRHEARRDARFAVDSGDRLLLVARSGSLRVEGRAGSTEVVIQGRACASSEDLLERIILTTDRDGSRAHVEVAEIDWEDGWFDGDRYARLDLTVEIPAGMRVEIQDGSGEMLVRGTGELLIDDGSGEIDIDDITGDVRIDDGSGEVIVANVRGSVTIDDGSGEVTVREVTGSVTVDDGSGSIEIAGVGGSVRVPDDGSGSLDVPERRGRPRRR